MRVLDLDMDFFLSGPCPLAAYGERPDEACCDVWRDEDVVSFLEERCGLSTEHPVPGAIFDTHDKAIDFWQARLADGSLTAPFEVVHVDTHSDLAFGPPGTNYVLNVVLSRLPQQRPSIDVYRKPSSWTRPIICSLRWRSAGSTVWPMCAIRSPIRIFPGCCWTARGISVCAALSRR